MNIIYCRQMYNLVDELQMNLSNYLKVEWCLNKDDISPQDKCFNKHKTVEVKIEAEAILC